MAAFGTSSRIKLLKLGIAAILLLSVVDYMRLLGYEWGPGWDFKCNCDAAYTLFRGGNPYRSLDYTFIRNAFTYLPFWLPVHGALCLLLQVSDIKTTVVYYPLYVGLFLAAVGFVAAKGPFQRFDRVLFAMIAVAGLNGFLWIARTGNIALFETICFLGALLALLRFCDTRQDSALRWFAVLFGCFMAVKTATLMFAVLIAFVPASRRQRLETGAIAVGVALIPLAVSYAFYSHLMPQYYLMLANKIEGNVNPHICSPSLYCFFRDIALVPSKLPIRVDLIRLLSQTIPTLLLGLAVAYAVGRSNGRALWSLFGRGDERRLPFAFKGSAFDAFLFGFLFLQLLMPRLKDYTFALPAVAFAFLIVRLPGSQREKIGLAAWLALPVIDFFEVLASGDSTTFGYYLQLYVALAAFLYLLVRYCHDSPTAATAPVDESGSRASTRSEAAAGPASAVTLLVASGLAVLVSIMMWQVSEGAPFREYPPANDFFRAYYPAGIAVWNGDAVALREMLADYTFVNLPVVAALFAPLGMLGKQQAALAYLVLGAGATIAALFLLWRLGGKERLTLPLLACLFLVNGPLIYSFKEGNSTHLVLFTLILALTLLRREATGSAGALFGLAALIKPPLLLLGLYFLVRRRWRVVAAGGTVVAGSVALSLLWFGVELNQVWLEQCILPFIGRPVHTYNSQSLDGFLIRWHLGAAYKHWGPNDIPAIYGMVRWLLVAVLLVVAVGAIRRLPPHSEVAHVAILTTVAIVVSPLSWTHYYCLLLLPWGLYIGGALRGDRIAHGLMLAGILLASPPVAHIPLHGAWRETLLWHFLSSSWLLGGLLTLAALARSRADEVGCTATEIATAGRRPLFWGPIRPPVPRS
jgi:hypothetical protein